MTTALWLGLLLGVRHALDPDHVVAVSALVARERRPALATLLGAAWAAGHGTMLLAFGLAALLWGAVFPQVLSQYAETGVGGMLVALGFTNLWAVRRPPGARARSASLWRAGAVGGMHGLAGSGLVVIVAASQLPTPAAVAVYLVSFGAGTCLGMVACSAALGMPLAWGRGPHLERALHALTGSASVVVGVAILAGLRLAPVAEAAVWAP